MKTLLIISVVFIVLWSYSGISYGETPEERARELLRSQTESQKKSNKKTVEHLDPIRPFGPFSWEDDLLTAVIKLNSLPGIEKVSLCDCGRNPEGTKGSSKDSNDREINLIGVQNKEQLQAVLTEYLKSPFTKHLLDNFVKDTLGEYLDAEGKKSTFLRMHLYLHASPVVIAGVPFTLEVYLAPSPGLSIAHPDKVTIGSLKDTKETTQVSFPVILTEVVLNSNSNILVQRYTDIQKILTDKYRKYYPNQNNPHGPIELGEGTIADPGNNGATQIYIHSGGALLHLEYRSSAYGQSLNQLYVEHLANLETKKLGNKVDLKKGL